MRLALVAVVVASLSSAASARADDARIALSWEEGLAEATRRNVPILVILQKDGAAMPFQGHLRQAAFVSFLNDRAVLLVGHRPNGHEPAKRADPRTKTEVEYCPVYPSIECSVHNTMYDSYAGRFDYTDLPAAFICRPDGTMILDKIERMGTPVITEKINDAQSQLGEGIFFSEIERLERKLQKGDEKLADGKLGPARKVYEGELEDAAKAFLRGICEERITRLDARALELIEEARAMAAGKPRSDLLHRIEREMRGRPPGERAAEVIKELGE
jgi:PAS domain-containing protein